MSTDQVVTVSPLQCSANRYVAQAGVVNEGITGQRTNKWKLPVEKYNPIEPHIYDTWLDAGSQNMLNPYIRGTHAEPDSNYVNNPHQNV